MTGGDLDASGETDASGRPGGLVAEVVVEVGELRVEAALDVGEDETVALVGPNGAGKSTLLRALAGLVPPSAGRVEVGGVLLDDPAAGVRVEPAERPVGLVFQDLLLFPRLTAAANVAFGLRSGGVGRREADRRAREWLDRMGLADRADARPAGLSGGEAQRVALARALAVEPALLLLDEPLASLDVQVRAQVRADLHHRLREVGGAQLLVTHDPADAFVLADWVVVLERSGALSRVTQAGTLADVAAHPRSRYAAEWVGMNLLHGRRGEDAREFVADGGASLHMAEPLPAGELAAVVRPQAVAIHRSRPAGSPRNVWETRVVGIEVDRDRARVRLADGMPLVAEVTPEALAELELRPGDEVWASVKAVDLTVHTR